MSDNINDLTGWQQVPCEVADLIRHGNSERKWPLKPFSSLTDLDGQFGAPIVYTEWGIEHPIKGDLPLLRECRYPGDHGGGDRKPCRHYVPEAAR